MEATQWAKQMAEKSRDPAYDVSDDIYVMMSTVFDEVSQLLHSLLAHEVKRSVLDEEIHKLAIATSPDPSLQTRYMRTADALLRQIVKNTDKIILEVIMMYNSLPIVHVYPTKSDSWIEFQPSIRKKQKERYVRSNTVETQSEKAVEVHKSVEVDGAVNQEDEDMDAHNYLMF
ncbi:hypothetical protein POM88_027714 [Heracleum sosnowskyi]|uniref:Uncharacterized protein n=1 Tax=Heracleum sosnowskyi TaxID=360622 RepID=A0AAD8MLQ3_9APIA|nr:hypothetical protein POM88_027714 [Heracleum sosnowskyi]